MKVYFIRNKKTKLFDDIKFIENKYNSKKWNNPPPELEKTHQAHGPHRSSE